MIAQNFRTMFESREKKSQIGTTLPLCSPLLSKCEHIPQFKILLMTFLCSQNKTQIFILTTNPQYDFSLACSFSLISQSAFLTLCVLFTLATFFFFSSLHELESLPPQCLCTYCFLYSVWSFPASLLWLCRSNPIVFTQRSTHFPWWHLSQLQFCISCC